MGLRTFPVDTKKQDASPGALQLYDNIRKRSRISKNLRRPFSNAIWCRGRDSNPHALRHRILNPNSINLIPLICSNLRTNQKSTPLISPSLPYIVRNKTYFRGCHGSHQIRRKVQGRGRISKMDLNCQLPRKTQSQQSEIPLGLWFDLCALCLTGRHVPIEPRRILTQGMGSTENWVLRRQFRQTFRGLIRELSSYHFFSFSSRPRANSRSIRHRPYVGLVVAYNPATCT